MKLNINGQKAEWLETHLTVYGSEGIYELEVQFADDPNVGASWDDLAKKAVYKNSALDATYPDGVYADIVDGVAQVPAAILSAPGLLYVGVMGEAAGVAMPTVWASPLAISPGCGEGQDAPPVVYDAARNAIKYGENAEVYAEGGYLVLEVEGTLDDPVLVRSDEHTDGAKDYADAAALSSNFASARAKDAEAYAIGTRDGEPVASDDPAYENNAKYYAGQAANSASDAHADAVAAHDDAVNAHADAQAAAGSASDASGYATAAGNAKTAAQSAQGYAEAAQTGAETAEGNAEAWSVGQRDGVDVPATDPAYNNNAKYYAGQAAASAAEAAQTAASIAADFAYLTAPDGISQVGLYQDRTATPGAIVTFADGAAVPAKSATIGIEPVQDLHGQANPWPAGGGKNKFDISAITPNAYLNSTGAVGTASSSCVSDYIPVAGVFTLSYTYTALASSNARYYCFYDSGKTFLPSGETYDPTNTATTITPPAGAAYVRITLDNNVTEVQVEAGATATDFAPYANICPITGHTAANITANSANLFEPVWPPDITGTYAGFAMPFKDEDFYVTLTDNDPTADISGCFFGLTTNGKDADGGYKWLINGGSVLERNYQNSQWHYGYMSVYPANEATLNKIKARFNIMLTPFSGAAYVPKVTQTIPVVWTDEAGTVYGGTLEYLGGKMWRLTVPDGHNAFSAFDTFAQGAIFAYGDFSLTGASSTGGANVSDVDTSVLKVSTEANAYSCRRNNANLRCFFPLGTTQAEAEALIAGMDTVYPLATPQTYDLTADELETLPGANVIFADTGDVEELTYRTSENSRTIVLGTSLSGVLEAISGFIGVSE